VKPFFGIKKYHKISQNQTSFCEFGQEKHTGICYYLLLGRKTKVLLLEKLLGIGGVV
jgi:hypothetical protein